MLNRKLDMTYVSSWIVESFSQHLSVILCEDSSEKLIIAVLVVVWTKTRPFKEDVFLGPIENTMLNSVSLHGVKNIVEYSW
jgi:RNA polymerase Rpb1, domain 7